MTVWLTWRREATSQLRWPPICVVTGQPATTGSVFVFQKPWMRWLPRGFRILAYASSPPVRLRLPVAHSAARRVRAGRLVLACGAVLVALSILAAVLLAMSATFVWAIAGFVAFVVAGAAVVVVGEILINIFGAGAGIGQLWIGKAHERFAEAFVRANSGLVEVAGCAPPGTPVRGPGAGAQPER
ncbi:MAG: hypothetical protein ACRDMV_23965 [Streptosporangiales bacterium]